MSDKQDKDQDDTGTDTGADDQDGSGDDGDQDDGPLLKDDGTPFTKADLDALNAALTKARREARAAKRGKTAEPADKPDADKPDVDKAVADATAAAESRWKPRVVRNAARGAFIEAGLVLPKDNADGALARVVKLLDLDDLEITDDGEVDGLREQVEEIKVDFPHLFTTTTGRTRTGRVDGADKSGQGNGKVKSSAEAIAALLG